VQASTLFIPDISGFTKFVKSTELNHSKHIIEELINLIIANGKDVFEIAEVEGDAVFMYKTSTIAPEEVMAISKKIFIEFHKHLLDYEHNRVCQCGACTSAVDLRLKFISHAGNIEFAQYSTGSSKPFGDAVITAHRLLKNNIPLDQYVLFTDKILEGHDLKLDGSEALDDDSLGKVSYHYLNIDHWRSEVVLDKKELTRADVDIEVRTDKVIEIEAHHLHHFVTELKFRHLWNEGVEKVIFDEDSINNTGNQHFCVVNGKDLIFDTIKPEFDQGLSYGEVLKNPAPLKYMEINFFLTHEAVQATRVEMVVRASVKWKLQFLMLPLMKRKLQAEAVKTLVQLQAGIEKALAEKML